MWSITPGAFVSIVQKAEDVEADTLTVRARDRRSLNEFCRLAGVSSERIDERTVTDYPFRLTASRAEVNSAALKSVDEIRYTNFKNEAKRVRGGVFVSFLGRVWVEGLELTPPAVRERAERGWRWRTERDDAQAQRLERWSGRDVQEDDWRDLEEWLERRKND